MTLEEQLLEDVRNGREVELERALLIVSGCDTEEKVSEYKAKLNELEKRYTRQYPTAGSVEEIARNIDAFLWNRPGERYDESNDYDFAKALDAQLSDEGTEGSCAVLSAVCLTLDLRRGLEMQVLQMPEHVAVRVLDNNRQIDIETIYTAGFNRPNYSNIRGLQPIAIVASLLNNRGTTKYMLCDYEGAIRDFSMAIKINHRHADAFYNMAIAKEKLGNIAGAKEDIAMYEKLSGETQ